MKHVAKFQQKSKLFSRILLFWTSMLVLVNFISHLFSQYIVLVIFIKVILSNHRLSKIRKNVCQSCPLKKVGCSGVILFPITMNANDIHRTPLLLYFCFYWTMPYFNTIMASVIFVIGSSSFKNGYPAFFSYCVFIVIWCAGSTALSVISL